MRREARLSHSTIQSGFKGEMWLTRLSRPDHDFFQRHFRAELVEVSYEPLTPVLDPEKAMPSDSPLIHKEWGDNLMLSAKIERG